MYTYQKTHMNLKWVAVLGEIRTLGHNYSLQYLNSGPLAECDDLNRHTETKTQTTFLLKNFCFIFVSCPTLTRVGHEKGKDDKGSQVI